MARIRSDDMERERGRKGCARLLKALRKEHPEGPPPDIRVAAPRAGVHISAPERHSGASSSFAWL